ncbi:hypothetical protein DXG03_004286 [Asterophora parasitica]|uniref:Rho-GAP domain-containing protein n=1 Tax=Asterophora parasitica TaxID=117018 RepID=A0A9P7G0Q2_9AGAR|nr:hypothetical protein DXG03_004286 [Asterophora parasitica]
MINTLLSQAGTMQHGSEHSAASSSHTGASPWPESSFPTSSSQVLSPATNTSLSTAMGQTFSRSHAATSSPAGPPSSPSTAHRGLTAAMTGGLRLKRAFAGRRKKSEDVGKATSIMDRSVSARDEQTAPIYQNHLQQRIQASTSTSSSPAQLASQVFASSSSKKPSKAQSPLHHRELPTSPPPPKPAQGVVLVAGAQPRIPSKATEPDYHSSMPISPGILSAVNYIRIYEQEARASLEREEAHAEEVNRGKGKEKEKLAEKKQDALAHAATATGTTRSRSQEKEREQTQSQGRVRPQWAGQGLDADADKGESPLHKAEKDAWRKSDSTMSHHTIRPSGRPPQSRPVSMAESLQSNHTIVPGPGGVSRRQSALISDADFGMLEEDSGSESDVEDSASNVSASTGISAATSTIPTTSESVSQPQIASSLKARDRRSMSVNIPTQAALAKHLPSTPASASATSLMHSASAHPPSTSPSPSHPYTQRVPPPSYIAPSSSSASPSSSPPRAHQQHRPPPITTTAVNNNPYTTFPPPPDTTRPASRMDRDRTLPALPHPSPRQPTLSMTGGLGLAAKRAVEKLGMLGKWGLSNTNTSVNTTTSATSNAPRPQGGAGGGGSGYSSGTSGKSAPSAYAGNKGFVHGYSSSASSAYELTRTSSGQSSLNPHAQAKPKKHAEHVHRRSKHAPNTPSISSVSTSASASASEAEEGEARLGPHLGKRLRGPLKSGGVVFGRDLKSVVRDTAVGVGKPKGWGGRWKDWDGEDGAGPGPGVGDYEQEGGGEEGGVGDGEGENRRSRKTSVRRGQLKALEERKLPALVVRCAQHLLIWGVQEEGLFRVPGRAFHVSKLRAEFDSGADFDMTECSPGDLDPHAVASVFKAFLRELPEPILTNALMPCFEAAMVQENAVNANKDHTRARSNSRGLGLPANPRSTLPAPMQFTAPAATLNKAPSLSTLAMPKLSGLPPPSKALCSAFQLLLARLPDENRDLVRTVTELIRATARDSVATKMPLSNLLLVFCPSLNMSPSLLRVLCEAEGIWDEIEDEGEDEEDAVPDTGSAATEAASVEEAADDDGEGRSLLSVSVGRRSDDVPSSVEYHASTEDVGLRDDSSLRSAPPSRFGGQGHARKGSVAASSLQDDGSSYLSTSEDHDNPARHCSDVHSQSISPPPLTSSAESLDTPASSSHHSLPHLPIEAGLKDPQRGPSSMIAEALPMGLTSTLRRPIISGPIPIEGSVVFPLSPSDNLSSLLKLERRRSIPILSLPSLSPNATVDPDSTSPTLSLASRAKRMKKPSLHLLFSKKSSSSLTSPRAPSSPATALKPKHSNLNLQTSRSASDSSVSTPLSAVTAPLPPQLDTPIENSPLRFTLGLTDVIETPIPATSAEKLKAPLSKAAPTKPRPLPVPPTSVAQQASVASLARPGFTPIADRYHQSLNDSDTNAPASHLRPNPTRSRGLSTSSSASSNHLGMLDNDDESEDWTRSVLLAADADGGWAIKPPARG